MHHVSSMGWARFCITVVSVIAVAACARPPTATLVATRCAEVGAPVTLDASDSHAADGATITAFAFDSADGNPVLTTAAPKVQHTYIEPGDFPATVRVTDGNGNTGAATAEIRIVSSLIDCPDLDEALLPRVAVDVCAQDGTHSCRVDFGTVERGVAAHAVIRVENRGATTLRVTPTLSAGSPALSIQLEPFEIPARAPPHLIPVEYVSDAPEVLRGILTLTTNASNAPVVDVALRATTPGDVRPPVLEPTRCIFGAVPWRTEATCMVTLTNPNGSSLIVTSALLENATSLFRHTLVSPATIAPQGVTSFEVIFTAAALGAYADALTVTTDAAADVVLPLLATVVNGPPIARATIATVDASPYRAGQEIRPFTPVTLSGASSSVGAPGRTIRDYRWRMRSVPRDSWVGLEPAGDHAAVVFSPGGPRAGEPGLDVVGAYVVDLVVVDSEGVESEPAELEINIQPGARLAVELVWHDMPADVDLHVINGGIERYWDWEWDCYFFNCYGPRRRQLWSLEPVHQPFLNRDDTLGGPEITTVELPLDGSYLVAVHTHNYPADLETDLHLAVRTNVRIFVDGLVVFQAQQPVTCEEVWTPAQIVVASGNITVVREGDVQPLRETCRGE